MEANLLDILWILVASSLVFIMQAGFAMVESGLTRSKNSINVAIKNLTDLGVSTIFFWAAGFGLMFGVSRGGWIGSSSFLFSPLTTWTAVFFLFQVMFCATSATIVSGAIAERVRYSAYIVSTIFLSLLVYPIFGHWVWGGALGGDPGWLGRLGFVDFAGSTVVHSLGGWVALAILLIIGPRTGRYDKDGRPVEINGSNIPMVVLGVLILWFGWFGFNGGSTLAMDASVAGIILRTTLSASAGMVVTLAVGWVWLKKPDVTLVMNGSLAGLVAITAPAHAVTELEAVLIGAVGGLVMQGCTVLLNRLKIDDAVGAIPVHLAAGAWGTLAVGIFGDPLILGTGLTPLLQTAVQLTGILVCGLWSFVVPLFLLLGLNKLLPFRISLEDEVVGLNKAEHGVTTEILDLYWTLQSQAETGDLSLRAPVEPFTEVGQIAGMYNTVMEKLEDNTVEIGEYLNILANVPDGMFLLAADGTIGRYYSASLEQILGAESLAGRRLASVLEPQIPGDTIGLFGEFCELAFDSRVEWRSVERLNPLKEVEASVDDGAGGFRVRRLEFEFRRVDQGSRITRLLALVRDVSEERALSEEVERTRRQGREEMELLYRILHVEPAVLTEFLAEGDERLAGINGAFSREAGTRRGRLEEAFRLCHAVKGDAELLELDFIGEKAEELERAMQGLLAKGEPENEDFIPLTLSLSALQQTFARMRALLGKWLDLSDAAGDVSRRSPGGGNYFAASLEAMAQRLAGRYGKEVELDIAGLSLEEIGPELRKPLREALVQLTRNAVFHGIEASDKRAALGKATAGRIEIRAEKRDGEIRLTFSDDGAGLDLEEIRSRAAEAGLIDRTAAAELPDSRVAGFIFASGLSTASVSDRTAGKGVGLPLVRELVRGLGGAISIAARRGRYCRFTITVPDTVPGASDSPGDERPAATLAEAVT